MPSIPPQVWVSPNSDGGWRIHRSGSKRDSAHTLTKKEATDRAREIANNQGAELKIQNLDGTLGGSDSHGRDPYPPKG